MDFLPACLFTFIFFLAINNAHGGTFEQTYNYKWGGNHFTLLDEGREVLLLIDQYSGSGFISKQAFGSGHFRINLKIPSKKSGGIITTFYLTSDLENNGGHHDELDFELLGSNDQASYTLNTNVFADDLGNREQQFKLWFNPTKDFHLYEILWNNNQTVFFIDGIPIRVFKNIQGRGGKYPTGPMYIQASIWNDTTWVGQVDWSEAPFTANYRGFEIDGCPYDYSNPSNCYSPSYSWNTEKLSPGQEWSHHEARYKYLTYDYCQQNSAYLFTECNLGENN